MNAPPDPARAATALIADDEDLPRGELRRLLARAWPQLQIVAEVEDGPAAIEALQALAPQIAFLDIRMPGHSGLDVARAASGRCHVVFTTAYDQHALAAFDAGAADYLLKPVQAERLAQTVARLQQRLAQAQAPARLEGWLDPLAERAGVPAEPLRWITASAGDVVKMIFVDEVLFFQSDEKYTRVVTPDDEAHIRRPLREIAQGLDEREFWQVHRGVIVRASAIARALRGEDGRITLQLRQHPERLAVSQAWAWRFRPM